MHLDDRSITKVRTLDNQKNKKREKTEKYIPIYSDNTYNHLLYYILLKLI